MPFNHLILCHPFLLLPPIFPSARVFSSELVLHFSWLNYWSFSFSINPSKEDSVLISFKIDWFDLLAVQGTLKSLLKHHCSKPSNLQCSASFMVQISPSYMAAGKTTALTRQTFVGITFFFFTFILLFNILSKEQACFNYIAAVTICSDFGAQKYKVSHCFHCFPIYLPWSDGTRCHDLSFLNVEF